MVSVTRIFRFEVAHAIRGYMGKCSNIHGHSYILHVTVKSKHDYLTAPGFVIDFKELKQIVNKYIIDEFDHKLVLSEDYVDEFENKGGLQNLFVIEAEPTAENMLVYISRTLNDYLPAHILLHSLKLYETNDSYAEWTKDY